MFGLVVKEQLALLPSLSECLSLCPELHNWLLLSADTQPEAEVMPQTPGSLQPMRENEA